MLRLTRTKRSPRLLTRAGTLQPSYSRAAKIASPGPISPRPFPRPDGCRAGFTPKQPRRGLDPHRSVLQQPRHLGVRAGPTRSPGLLGEVMHVGQGRLQEELRRTPLALLVRKERPGGRDPGGKRCLRLVRRSRAWGRRGWRGTPALGGVGIGGAERGTRRQMEGMRPSPDGSRRTWPPWP